METSLDLCSAREVWVLHLASLLPGPLSILLLLWWPPLHRGKLRASCLSCTCLRVSWLWQHGASWISKKVQSWSYLMYLFPFCHLGGYFWAHSVWLLRASQWGWAPGACKSDSLKNTHCSGLLALPVTYFPVPTPAPQESLPHISCPHQSSSLSSPLRKTQTKTHTW